MSLLNIQVSKKISATCSLEESTAFSLNHYAIFLEKEGGEPVTGDAILDGALKYVFEKDKKFQNYMESHGSEKAPAALKVKKPIVAQIKPKSTRKQHLAIAQ